MLVQPCGNFALINQKTEVNKCMARTIYKQIYETLETEINNGIYNESATLPSEKELCERFGVERNTVRKALKILVDDGLVIKKPGYGTILAGSGFAIEMQKSNSKTVSQPGWRNILLVAHKDYLQDNGEYFHFSLINRFENSISEMGYNLLFKPVGTGKGLSEVVEHTSPAAIIFDSYMSNEMYHEGLKAGVPCVSVNHSTSFMSSVIANNIDGAYRVTKMLAEYGHKRIAVITGIKNYQTSIERMSGVQKYYLKEGKSPDEILILDGDWLFASGADAGKLILEMPLGKRPTAVFGFNDDMAFGCYSALTNAGIRIPEDISIVGFDKSDRYDSIFPSLTTVDANVDAMVEYACWVISGCLDGSAPENCATIQVNVSICDNGTIMKL